MLGTYEMASKLAIGVKAIASDQPWQLAALSIIPLSGVWIDKSLRHLFRKVLASRHKPSGPMLNVWLPRKHEAAA